MSRLASIYEQAKLWLEEAGRRLRHSVKQEIVVQYKTSVADLVTEKDREIEQFFIERINRHYPEHQILAEEGLNPNKIKDPHKGWVWIIDPIDGTTNFVHQRRNFCISVALYEGGAPRMGLVYDPMAGELFSAIAGNGAYLNEEPLSRLSDRPVEEAVISTNSLWLTPNRFFDYRALHTLVGAVRGTRSLGSAALELAYVASGRLDAYLALRLAPWDFAAGLLIAQEVGAVASTVHNDTIPLFKKSSLFVARPGLHQTIIDQYLTPGSTTATPQHHSGTDQNK